MPAVNAECFFPRGYCYGGFRDYPTSFEIPLIGKSKAILLVRDPRDLIVSQYFVLRYSHDDTGQGMRTGLAQAKLDSGRRKAASLSIDEFVLASAEEYAALFANYIDVIERHAREIRIFRYEDVIFDKKAWVASMCEFFAWPLSPTDLEDTAYAFDVLPAREDVTAHCRQVSPGDAGRKLKAETVQRLSQIFQKELAFFGYARDPGEVCPIAGETPIVASPMPERFEIGTTQEAGVRAVGLFGRETVNGRPLRWTGGLAEFSVPLNPATLPRRIAFKLWGISPASGTTFRVLADDAEVFSGRIDGEPLNAEIPLPSLAGADRLVVTLESSTFRPEGDSRTLGVAIESIALCR